MPMAVNTRAMKTVLEVAPAYGYGLALGAFDLRQRHRLDGNNWNCECGRKCRHRKHELEHVPLRGVCGVIRLRERKARPNPSEECEPGL
jgi:hypothetical protein